MKHLGILIICYIMSMCCLDARAQQYMALYPTGIPNSKASPDAEYSRSDVKVDSLTFNVSIPSLRIYRPETNINKGTAVIICPGGGYHVLLTKREGSDIAKAFAAIGVTAFVLKYRLPGNLAMVNPAIGPLQDAQQAIKIVREHAEKWNLDPEKIGVMGFSAGGHLASSLGTHFEKPLIPNVEGTSLRPDFMLLVNPVISFNLKIGHAGSRTNLLGQDPEKDMIDFFSNELHVHAGTPVTWLVHSSADEVVPVANSLVMYEALLRNGVNAEIHLYASGTHGFLTAPPFEEWFGRCIYWMKSKNLIVKN